ncbi:hypothetical protein [Streptomyces sp. TRM70350]|uniref:hypothetical protein n=1 Tax=Streptomyces sp. TRM70350 TaxID=2856165 RepID=UPI001C442D97|nr:hypothetical protein [Streptomyces sp. TRM70350]MBV7696711.1 hypothetical protein [Streptomyces sp. TRM70350]
MSAASPPRPRRCATSSAAAADDRALERLPPEHRPATAWARAEYPGRTRGLPQRVPRICADAVVRALADQPS